MWALVFFAWFRDNPRDHRSVNAAELELLKENEQNVLSHGNVPWGRLCKSRAVWLLGAQYFCLSYGWYFYVTWLPTYFKDARGTEITSNALMKSLAGLLEHSFTPDTTLKVLAAALTGLPLLFGGAGSLVAGVISSRLIARGRPVAVVRRTFGFIGLAGAASLLMTSLYIRDPLAAMLTDGHWPVSSTTPPCREAGRPAWTLAANTSARSPAA